MKIKKTKLYPPARRFRIRYSNTIIAEKIRPTIKVRDKVCAEKYRQYSYLVLLELYCSTEEQKQKKKAFSEIRQLGGNYRIIRDERVYFESETQLIMFQMCNSNLIFKIYRLTPSSTLSMVD